MARTNCFCAFVTPIGLVHKPRSERSPEQSGNPSSSKTTRSIKNMRTESTPRTANDNDEVVYKRGCKLGLVTSSDKLDFECTNTKRAYRCV